MTIELVEELCAGIPLDDPSIELEDIGAIHKPRWPY
jgi:hypothetical protein